MIARSRWMGRAGRPEVRQLMDIRRAGGETPCSRLAVGYHPGGNVETHAARTARAIVMPAAVVRRLLLTAGCLGGAALLAAEPEPKSANDKIIEVAGKAEFLRAVPKH